MRSKNCNTFTADTVELQKNTTLFDRMKAALLLVGKNPPPSVFRGSWRVSAYRNPKEILLILTALLFVRFRERAVCWSVPIILRARWHANACDARGSSSCGRLLYGPASVRRISVGASHPIFFCITNQPKCYLKI